MPAPSITNFLSSKYSTLYNFISHLILILTSIRLSILPCFSFLHFVWFPSHCLTPTLMSITLVFNHPFKLSNTKYHPSLLAWLSYNCLSPSHPVLVQFVNLARKIAYPVFPKVWLLQQKLLNFQPKGS